MADTATSKIRIRMGQVEIEYEGSHDYLKADLPKLLETLVTLRANAGDEGRGDDQEETPDDKKKKKKTGSITGTVAAIAAKLGVKTGPDLAIAAAAQLTLVANKESFKRLELLNAMKSATSYYKQTYSGNFSLTLKRLLTDDRLTEPSTGTYALTAKERTTLEAKLRA